MTMDTEQLIARLSADVRPVRRLDAPIKRALLWIGISAPYLMLVVLVMSPRPDLTVKLGDLRYLVEQGAALATAVLAAVAAFSLGVPGRPRAIALLPLPALAVWLGSLGEGCWQAWVRLDADGLALSPDWICFPAIVFAGAIPGAAMVAMMRRGAPLAPHLTVALGALAAAALGNVGLRLFHVQDASLMVLVWQFGTVALLSALAGLFGGRVLHWRHPTVAA
jgi:hypothetical protein